MCKGPAPVSAAHRWRRFVLAMRSMNGRSAIGFAVTLAATIRLLDRRMSCDKNSDHTSGEEAEELKSCKKECWEKEDLPAFSH